MSRKFLKNEVLEVTLEDGTETVDPQLISVTMPSRPSDMPGEILIAPGDVPDLVKDLVSAALAAYQVD